MDDARLGLLRGKITAVDTYESPVPGRGKKQRIPSLDAKVHGARLLSQLDAIREVVNSRSETTRDGLRDPNLLILALLGGLVQGVDTLATTG